MGEQGNERHGITINVKLPCMVILEAIFQNKIFKAWMKQNLYIL